MTREQLTRALDLAEAGLPAGDIGREVGVDPDSVRSACRFRGIKLAPAKSTPRPRPWREEDDAALRRLFALNRTDSEIARTLNRGRHQVQMRRTELGLRRGFA